MYIGHRLDDSGSRVRFRGGGAGNFSLHHRFRTGFGTHTTSYPMGTRDSIPGGKAAGEWSWPLTSIWCRGQRMSGAIPPLPNTPSWSGARLKKAQEQLYLTFYIIRRRVIKVATFHVSPPERRTRSGFTES
jgi:hypothetical protein